MEPHDLTAGYALDALSDEERETYEAHLAHCERCRAELAELTEAAAALAWAVESPAPPASLRERVLGTNVVPLRRRGPWREIAAVAACAAVGLGIWAGIEHNSLGNERAHASALEIVVDPASHKVALDGKRGMVAVAKDGRGVLVVDDLAAAPRGTTYVAWVIPQGGKPERAGVFDGGDGMTMVKLRTRVPRGATVAATVERDPGVDAPTQTPFVTART
jgi:anti-sigma factor RsiW